MVGVCGASAVVLTLQNVLGMILDAVSLGVIFAKLSHPKHRGRSIFISECATIARRDGQLKFMIRVADIRCVAHFWCGFGVIWIRCMCACHFVSTYESQMLELAFGRCFGSGFPGNMQEQYRPGCQSQCVFVHLGAGPQLHGGRAHPG